MNKQQIVTWSVMIVLVLLFSYMAYGSEESLPTPKEISDKQRARLLEEQTQIDRDNLRILDWCNQYAQWAKADEKKKSADDCYNLQKIPDLVIPNISTWTVAPASSGVPERKVNLRSVFNLWDCRFTNDKHKMPKYNLEWLAYDIACEAGKAFNVSTPNFNKESWTVATVSYGKSLGNYVIIRQWDIRIVYGHTSTQKKEWDILASWEVFWVTDMSWESTGMHLHLELWKWHKIVSREFFWSDTYDSWDQTRLLAHRRWNFDNKYYFTHYDLGDISQNDWAPCIGASWKDLCELEKKGIRTMAITSDIRKLMGIKFWDTVTLVGDPGCAGTYQVHDEMNKRYRQTPWVKRPWTPYYIKGDLPSKEWWACYIIK